MTRSADSSQAWPFATIASPPLPPPRTPVDTDVRHAEARAALQGRRSDTLEAGRIVGGRYRIEKMLGQGGMATVYLARHVDIGASVAIKVMHRVLSYAPEIVDRFLSEARAVSKVHNPHVVRVSDYGELDDGPPWMVMEYLQGEDLAVCLDAHGHLPWRRVRSIVLQLCEALQAVHDAGIVHCDVKPQNCLRQAEESLEDFVKLLDFGIARMPGMEDDGFEDRVIGTPEYMAPEQARGGGVDARTDVYALGVLTFVLLTGRGPFEADEPSDLLIAHLHETPPAPSDVLPGLDPAIDAVVLEALAKNPEHRFASMQEMAETIRAIPCDPPADIQPTDVTEPAGKPDHRTVALPAPESERRGRRWALALAVGSVLALVVPLPSFGAAAPQRAHVGMAALSGLRLPLPVTLAEAKLRSERPRAEEHEPPASRPVRVEDEDENDPEATVKAKSEAKRLEAERTEPEPKKKARRPAQKRGAPSQPKPDSMVMSPIKNPFE